MVEILQSVPRNLDLMRVRFTILNSTRHFIDVKAEVVPDKDSAGLPQVITPRLQMRVGDTLDVVNMWVVRAQEPKNEISKEDENAKTI
jgi:hypothetical protein